MNQLYNQRRDRVAQKGFTLIELMLSMSGVAFLLLAIAMTTMQISNIYSKGITLKSVNQTGRDLSDVLQRDIKGAKPFDVTPGSSKYISTEHGGRLCLGKYSYVWNYGKTITAGVSTDTIVYDDSGNTPVRMARVLDTGGQVCASASTSPTPPIKRSDATELLVSSDKLDLALHTFTVASSNADPGTNQALYSVGFTLGTNDQEALATGDASCKPPNDDSANWEFCAINVFDFTTRAGNRT